MTPHRGQFVHCSRQRLVDHMTILLPRKLNQRPSLTDEDPFLYEHRRRWVVQKFRVSSDAAATVLDTPYLSLSCPARPVLVEIGRCYDVFNNGRIGLSVRKAAERCKIAPGAAKRAFEERQDRGFIECVTKGGFSRLEAIASWLRQQEIGSKPTRPDRKARA